MHDHSELAAPHRLFHALVVMGSALAVSCGGISDQPGAERAGHGGTDTNDASGGAPVGGSPSHGGGGSAGLAAGTSSAGGGGTIHINPPQGGAGSGATGDLQGLPPLAGSGGTKSSAACPPAQWDCRGAPRECGGPVGYLYYYGLPPEFYGLPSECRCDETRPQKPADCAGMGAFVCRAGIDQPSDAAARTVPFDCSCEIGSTTVAPCRAAFGDAYQVEAVTEDGIIELCACAVVLLR